MCAVFFKLSIFLSEGNGINTKRMSWNFRTLDSLAWGLCMTYLLLFLFSVLSKVKGISLENINCLDSCFVISGKNSSDKKSQGLSTKTLLAMLKAL